MSSSPVPGSPEARFRARLDELGATLLEPEWLGRRKPHHVRCAAGHDTYPRPDNVLTPGRGICVFCANRDPGAAEARFQARLAELGATPLYEKYLGKDGKHQVRCAAGHICWPRPSHLRRGGGVCAPCAANDPATAEEGFLTRLRELGATPAYGEWMGVGRPHHVVCVAGHDCYPWPTSVQQGRGVCRACANQDPATAAAGFRERLAEMGATLIDAEWRGANARYLAICAQGHECRARPGDVQQGGGICRACIGTDPAQAEAAFRARIAELGGTPLYEKYTGNGNPHHARCAEGHDCYPRPGDVQSGRGICRHCAGKNWDVFYVVTSASGVKFGITSGDPRPRISDHAAAGYANVLLLEAGLPGTVAPDAERAVLSALALAGELPVKGREYFDISCLALILDVADSWLGHQPLSGRGSLPAGGP